MQWQLNDVGSFPYTQWSLSYRVWLWKYLLYENRPSYTTQNYETLAQTRRKTVEMRRISMEFLAIFFHSQKFIHIWNELFFAVVLFVQFDFVTLPNVNISYVWQPKYTASVLELHNLVMNLQHLFLHNSDVFFHIKVCPAHASLVIHSE